MESPHDPTRTFDANATTGYSPTGDEPTLSRAGPYRVGAIVGRGGMGVVYRVRDDACERELAVKVLQARLADDASAVARFVREAKLTAQLQHPAIPPVHAVGTLDDGRPFFAMKLIQGRTLAELLHGGEERSRLLAVFVQVAQAVGYAHQLGVVHRDLKPANVMVGAFGEVQVMDWGLASSTREEAGSVMGTVAYMPPEQARGEAVDSRADVFSLGAILCEILTGRPPITGGDMMALLRRVQAGDLAEAFARLDACGDDLAALAKRCLAAAADRPADAATVADAVLAYQADLARRLQQAEQERATALVRAAEARKRRRLAVALAGVVAVALLAAAGVWLWLGQQRAAARALVEYALDQAGEALGRDDLLAARSSVDRARALLPQTGSDDFARRVDQRAGEVDVADRIEEIRAPTEDSGEANDDRRSADRQYAELFRKIGIDVDALTTEEAADRIEASAVRGQLLVALHDWVVPRQTARRDDPASWGRLLDLAGRLDPQPWRKGMRDAVRRQDRAALLELARTAAVRDNPPAVLLLLGEALVRSGEVEGAVALMRRARWQFPGDFLLHHRSGWWQRNDPVVANLNDATNALTAAIALRPNHAGAWVGYGKVLATVRRSEEAIRACERAIELAPDVVSAYVYLAQVHRKAGRAEQQRAAAVRGIAVSRRLLEKSPELPRLWNVLGLCLQEAGQPTEALSAFQRAIELDSGYHYGYNNLGWSLQQLGRPREAVGYFLTAFDLQPQNQFLFTNLLSALSDAGQLEDVALRASQYLAEHPGADVYNQFGSALNQLNRLDEALAASREGVRRSKEIVDDGMIHNNLAYHLLSKGDSLAEAEIAIAEAVRIKPHNITAILTLAEIRQAQGRFAESLAAFRKGHELQEKAINQGMKFPTAKWVADAERLVELDRLLPGVLAGKVTPKTAAECLEFARVCGYKSMHASALRFFREAFRLDPKTEVANRYQASRCALLLADGRGPEASGVGDDEKAKLRREALAWLRADLAKWQAAPRMTGLKAVNHADTHDDLLSVRDPARREKLPADEQTEWAAFWAEVKAFRAQVNQRPATQP